MNIPRIADILASFLPRPTPEPEPPPEEVLLHSLRRFLRERPQDCLLCQIEEAVDVKYHSCTRDRGLWSDAEGRWRAACSDCGEQMEYGDTGASLTDVRKRLSVLGWERTKEGKCFCPTHRRRKRPTRGAKAPQQDTE